MYCFQPDNTIQGLSELSMNVLTIDTKDRNFAQTAKALPVVLVLTIFNERKFMINNVFYHGAGVALQS